MRTSLYFKIVFIGFNLIFATFSSQAQKKPELLCDAAGIDPGNISSGSGGGQAVVTVSTVNDCSNYTVTENLTWLSFTRNRFTLTFTFQANSGPARSGYVYIGDIPLEVYQACNLPGSASSITGSNSFCRGQNGVHFSVGSISGATSYSWTLPTGVTITSGSGTNSITTNISSGAVSGNVTVSGTNTCGSGTASNLSITVHTLPVPSVQSNSPICYGGRINLSTNSWNSYSWTGPNGFSSNQQNPYIDNSTTVMTGNYTVAVIDSYGCSGQNSASVTVNTLPTPTISGSVSICSNSTGNVYTTEAGKNSYSWTIIGGTSTSGGGSSDNSVTVTWGAEGLGHVKVNYANSYGCTAASQTDKQVTIKALPTPTINGQTIVCPYSLNNIYTTETGKTSYSWSVTGGSITSGGGSSNNSVTIRWSTEGTGHVKVNYTNSVGCSATSQVDLPITIRSETGIVTNPLNKTITINEEAIFTVVARGPNLQYQWQVSSTGGNPWTNLTGPPASGYNTNTLTIQGPSTYQILYYRCHITSDCQMVNSNAATLTVSLPSVVYLSGEEIPDPDDRELNTALTVGSTHGSYNVGSNGSASYNIPILIPPGTNGMQPSISLSYNSMSSGGLLGMGWGIAGLSSITRINKPFYIDGNITGINLDGSDSYSLDGNRLVISQNVSGYDGDIFKTEVETFTKITSKGTSGNGPDWFEVELKNGTIIEYGNSPNSVIEATNGTIIAWNITRITDPMGNYCEYIYNEELGAQKLLEKIIYTGNTNTNLEPYNEIHFFYKRKSDSNNLYFPGLTIPQNIILTRIECISEDNTLRSYELKYTNDLYSRLVELVEKGSNDNQLNSTIIKWKEPSATFQTKEGASMDPKNSTLYTGDFNGDGNADIITTPKKLPGSFTGSDSWKLFLGSPSGYNLITEGYLDVHFRGFIIADGDNDGDDDIYKQLREEIQQPCSESQMNLDSLNFEDSNSFEQDSVSKPDTSSIVLTLPCFFDQNTFAFNSLENNELTQNQLKDIVFIEDLTSDIPQMIPADFNGNGLVDYLFIDESKNILSFSNLSVSSYPNLNSPYRVFIMDFNADGKSDLATLKFDIDSVTTLVNIFSYNSINHSFDTLLSDYEIVGDIAGLGDFNGDGKTDILTITTTYNPETHIYYSTGNGLIITDGPITENLIPEQFPENPEPPFTYISDINLDLIVNDFNGDGKSDIFKAVFVTSRYYTDMHFHQDTTTFDENVYLSNGMGFQNKHINNGDGNHSYSQLDNNHDGNSDLLVSTGWVNNEIFEFFPDDKSNLISSITDGNNLKAEFTYKSLLDSTVYSRVQETYTSPVFPIAIPLKVVSGLTVSNNNDQSILEELKYSYMNLKAHRQGKGNLGFTKVIAKNLTTGHSNLSQYAHDDTYFKTYLYKSKDSINGNIISEVTNNQSFKSFDNGTRYLPYNSVSVHSDEINGTSSEILLNLDSSGNISEKSTRYYDATETLIKEINTNFYEYNELGLPDSIKISNTRGDETITRFKSINYNHETGLIEGVNESYSTLPAVTTNYDYDDLGNTLSVTITSGNISRQSGIVYEKEKGRYPIAKFDAISDTLKYTYNSTGNILTATDISGLITSFQYDEFGNLNKTSLPDNRVISDTLIWSLNSEGIGELYLHRSHSIGKPVTLEYYDILGRKLRSKTQAFDGVNLVSDIYYDQAGRVENSYRPYFEGDSPNQYVHYDYDDYDRVITETYHPNDSTVNYNYGASSVTIIKAGQSYEKEYDASGLLVESTDPGGAIQYAYNAEDKVKQITSPSGNTTMGYDDYGFQNSLQDIDAGTIEYTYNAFGELKTQTDAKGNEMNLSYDDLGRVVTKSYTVGETITYVYNTLNGQLNSLTSSLGIKKRFEYDALGRLQIRVDSIDSNNRFTTSYNYDNESGNLESLLINNSVSVNYGYNNYGYLNQVSSGTQTLWTANSMNKYGVVDNFTLGNQANTSITYDPNGFINSIVTVKNGNYLQNWDYTFSPFTGNLLSRTGLNSSGGSVEENFTYDNLNRILSYSVGEQTNRISYDENGRGNIISKSDVGNYNYTSGAHNVGTISTPTTLLQNLPKHYTDYTKFNKVSSIIDTLISNEVRELNLFYGPDEQRYKTVYNIDNSVVSTKYFALGQYEKEVDSVGNIRELYYISSTNGIVAMIEKKNDQDSIYYIHTDYLGSIDVISRQDGFVKQRNNFDPWGRRRNPNDWSYNNVSQTNFIDRGFTGHEHLDQFNLINMNGRVYDPLLAMFLSPDNFVQSADLTQNLNRYSYCLNNPLIYTDPSGNDRTPVPYLLDSPYTEFSDIASGKAFSHGYSAAREQLGLHTSGPSYCSYTYDPSSSTGYRDQHGKEVLFSLVSSSLYISKSLTRVYNSNKYSDYLSSGFSIYYYNLNGIGNLIASIGDPGLFSRTGGGYGATNNTASVFPVVTSGTNSTGGWAGHSFTDYLSFGFSAGDLYYSGTGSALHNELYWVQKNGIARLTSNIGNNHLLQRSYRITGELAESAKIAARSFSYASTAISGINMVTDFRFANTFDFAMGLTTFFPGVGWAISGLYFISNVAVESYTGKTIGEHLELQINKIGQ